MDRRSFFDRNLQALSQRDPELCSRLAGAKASNARYKILESRSGEPIPSMLDSKGIAHPLHSTMDPRKEARRLIDSIGGEGFLVLLGLGGGYYAEAALERDDAGMLLVVEYGIEGLAELLCRMDYTRLFADPRFRLLADSSGAELERSVLSLYQPVLYGGIRLIPLRARTDLEAEAFALAGSAVGNAIDKVSADYSVQAHFGMRWFSNIVRNLKRLGECQGALLLGPGSKGIEGRTAVCAAGPSLSMQIPRLRERREGIFLIATDTSLPCLLNAGIKPDAAISMDCQHISYHHFMDGLPEDVLLFLDLASPPLLSSLSKSPRFFSGGHPLTRHISRYCPSLGELDCSGGNVSYAALSLAEQLGAKEIELYGADFSYPGGISYARGSYVFPFFAKRQNRLFPLEAQASAFLYRTPLEKKSSAESSTGPYWYYETKPLKFYRERLEEKSGSMEAKIIPVEGLGAPIQLRQGEGGRRSGRAFAAQSPAFDAEEFLGQYRAALAKLGSAGKSAAAYLASLGNEERNVLASILPVAAALKKRHPGWAFQELLEETKAYCMGKIDSARE